MTANTLFGQFISEKRIQNSMTKQDLARQIGTSTAYLSQIESGVQADKEAVNVLTNMLEPSEKKEISIA